MTKPCLWLWALPLFELNYHSHIAGGCSSATTTSNASSDLWTNFLGGSASAVAVICILFYSSSATASLSPPPRVYLFFMLILIRFRVGIIEFCNSLHIFFYLLYLRANLYICSYLFFYVSARATEINKKKEVEAQILHTGFVFVTIALVGYVWLRPSQPARNAEKREGGWHTGLIGSCRGVFKCVHIYIYEWYG